MLNLPVRSGAANLTCPPIVIPLLRSLLQPVQPLVLAAGNSGRSISYLTDGLSKKESTPEAAKKAAVRARAAR